MEEGFGQVDVAQSGASQGRGVELQQSDAAVVSEAGPSRDQDEGSVSTSLGSGVDWALLPDIATTAIASYLLPWQRGYMAMTCTGWHRAVMQTPRLWRAKEFRICGNWRDSQHLAYARSVGRHLRSVRCTFGFRSHRHPRRLQRLFTGLLAELYRRGPVQLRELFVTSLQFARNFQSPDTAHARVGIARSLGRFLRRQTGLETLDLSDCTLRPTEGIGFLAAASEHSSARLKELYMDELFQAGSAVNAERGFADTMRRFTGLVEVTLNYSCVSGELLSALAGSCSSSLELLSIITYRQDSHDHTVDQDAWVEFREAIPRARVKLSMSGIMRMAAVYRILTPGMPLSTLRVFGHNDGGFHPDRTLRHLARHYPSSLVSVLIDVGPVYDPYSRGLDAAVRRCARLESLQLHGRIAWPALRDVFDFVDEAYIKKGLRPSLAYFRMVITTIGFGQEEALVMEEFRPIFNQHNLNYDIVFDPMYPLPLGPVPPVDGEPLAVNVW